jgi:8-oxo-dGTP pyrophosphatase MutT (NUDIX family)
MAKRPSEQTKRSPGAGRSGLSGPPPSLQVGALCWRLTRKGALRVLLITSLDTGRWIIPKGWPMRRRSEAEAAAREAWEEAGVIGAISGEAIGFYSYPKIKPKGAIPCVVRVYPLRTFRRERVFPEAGRRRLKWFSPAKAARKVGEPELARLIRGFRPEEMPASAPAIVVDPAAEGSGDREAPEPRQKAAR